MNSDSTPGILAGSAGSAPSENADGSKTKISFLPSEPSASEREDLAALLLACVRGGASIGYLETMTASEAASYWDTVIADLAADRRVILVAREASARDSSSAGRIIGSVQLTLEQRPNGRHRAEVQKLLVLPTHRRRGLGSQLMRRIEEVARERGRRLLFLDTSEGPGGARRLYDMLGYTYAGGIPDYALDPDGRPTKNAIYYKQFATAREA